MHTTRQSTVDAPHGPHPPCELSVQCVRYHLHECHCNDMPAAICGVNNTIRTATASTHASMQVCGYRNEPLLTTRPTTRRSCLVAGELRLCKVKCSSGRVAGPCAPSEAVHATHPAQHVVGLCSGPDIGLCACRSSPLQTSSSSFCLPSSSPAQQPLATIHQEAGTVQPAAAIARGTC
jgi:hypothetical protein